MDGGFKIPSILRELRRGRPVIVMDPDDRENEGDLIMAAEFADRETIAFFVNNTTGIICCPLTLQRAQQLELDIMVKESSDPLQTAYTITVDSVDVGTGVSADDRAKSLNQLADPRAGPERFRRPGHIFPLISRNGGVLERMGHTEAAVDLLKLAGLIPVGVIAELVNPDGSMKRLSDCMEFASQHNLSIIGIEDIATFIRFCRVGLPDMCLNSNSTANGDSVVSKVENDYSRPLFIDDMRVREMDASCNLPLVLNGVDLGTWKLRCFFSEFDGYHHIVLEKGDLSNSAEDPVLLRVHSECFTGDTLGSQCCDCGEQLFESLNLISRTGRGLFIYYSGHEGRGIGITYKILAYYLQQSKFVDTYKANHILGFPDDLRIYRTAISILEAMDIKKVILISNNYEKLKAFEPMVEKVISLDIAANSHNERYLHAKKRYSICKYAEYHKHTIGTSSSFQSDVCEGNNEQSDTELNDKDFHVGETHLQVPGISKSIPTNLNVEDTESLRITIVHTSWNHLIVDSIVEAITGHLKSLGIKNLKKVMVPGSFEIPYAANKLAAERNTDAIICVGVLLKGETLHFEMISNSVVHGLMKLQIEKEVPIINAVLNCLTMDQALERASPTNEVNYSIASTAVYMAAMKSRWEQNLH